MCKEEGAKQPAGCRLSFRRSWLLPSPSKHHLCTILDRAPSAYVCGTHNAAIAARGLPMISSVLSSAAEAGFLLLLLARAKPLPLVMTFIERVSAFKSDKPYRFKSRTAEAIHHYRTAMKYPDALHETAVMFDQSRTLSHAFSHSCAQCRHDTTASAGSPCGCMHLAPAFPHWHSC